MPYATRAGRASRGAAFRGSSAQRDGPPCAVAGARAADALRRSRGRLRSIVRRARELQAHVHVDMESLDSRETVLALVLELLAEPEFARGPSAGIVLQAYLRDSRQELDQILEWVARAPREPPLTIRLVQGAYS